MPDVLGIRLGASARDAEAAVKASANGTFQTHPFMLPLITPPPIAYSMNLRAVGPAGNDQLIVDVTPPPNTSVVWRVLRITNMMRVNRGVLLASLREKYGKETAVFANGGGPVRSDRDIDTMFWLMDEQGRRVAPRRIRSSCSSATS